MRALFILFLAMSACSGREDSEEEERTDKRAADPVTVVEVTEVQKGSVAEVLTANAAVEAEASADLMPAASGMVIDIRRDIGDTVKRGDVLAIIDNVNLDASAERARSEVTHLTARLAEMEELQASGAVSAREVADVAYQLRTAKTTLREAAKTYGETRITAPFAGIVAARDVKVGEQVNSGGRAFQIVDMSELLVHASLPERDVAKVALGQTAQLVSAYDSDQTAIANVTRISPVIDANTGTFKVTLTLDQEQNALRPGQFVSVALEVDRRTDIVVVPKEAVLYDNGVPIVYRMVEAPEEEEPDEEDGEDEAVAAEEVSADDEEQANEEEDTGPRFIAQRVVVGLGLTDVSTAQITAGLELGEQIVTVGHTSLKDGVRIRLPETPTAASEAVRDGEEG